MKRLTTVLATTTAALLTLTLVPSSAGAAVGAGDWAQRGAGPARTSEIRSPGNLRPATVAGVHRTWSAPTEVWSGSAVADGVLYGTDLDGHLVATSAVDGHQLWSAPVCGGARQNTSFASDTAPAVAAGVVWVSTGAYLSGIRLATHTLFACLPAGTSGGNDSPTLVDGLVLTNNARSIVAYDATTGALRWRSALPTGWRAVDAPVADRGLVFVPASTGRFSAGAVFALAERDGSLVWTYRGGSDPVGLAVSDGRVYVGGAPAALDEMTGHPIWTHYGYVLDGGVSVSGGRVFVFGGEANEGPGNFNPDGELIAFDAATGARLWVTDIASEGDGVPSVGNGVVYLTDQIDFGHVFVINAATGRLIRELTHPAGSGFYDAQPLVVDGSIYLHGYSQDSGAPFYDQWALPAA